MQLAKGLRFELSRVSKHTDTCEGHSTSNKIKTLFVLCLTCKTAARAGFHVLLRFHVSVGFILILGLEYLEMIVFCQFSAMTI